MKLPTLLRFALAAGISLLALRTPLNAQTSPTGVVEGRVQNSLTGNYLGNVRVTAEGTGRSALTNEFGEYRLTGLPAGPVRIVTSYSGLGSESTRVTVTAGGTAHADFSLSNDDSQKVVQLDEFTVAATREMNAASLAINEQRYAPNIKNVVAADAFGDVTEGNVGEFIKYLPGVSVDYVAADVRTISVRGLADNFTSVNVDGARMASSASGNSIRTFELEQVSINNVSRVEVSKEPTPSMPADSLGGSVNMISRSAFERSRPEFKYRAYLSANSEDLQLFSKTPGPGEDRTYKALPGFDFSYINPVSKNFGVAISGLSSNQFNEQHRSQTTYRFSGAGATVAAPYLRQYQLQDGPKNTYRDSASVKLDWRPAERHVLSLGAQANYYHSFFGNRNLNFDVGSSNTATGTSTAPATGLTFGPTFMHGATNRGSVNMGGSWRDKYGATLAGNLNWRYDGTDWEADAGVNASKSKTWYRLTERGHFNGYSVTLRNASRVLYDNIDEPRPASITVLDAAGQPIDYTDLSNYQLNNANANPVDGLDQFIGGHANVKRKFTLFDAPAALKTGIDYRRQNRDMRRQSETWTYLGPDGNASTGEPAAKFRDPAYSGEDPFWGFPQIDWPNAYAIYRDFQGNPSHWTQTDTNLRDAYNNRVNGSEQITEKVSAGYLQAEFALFHNRLSIVTGARYEKTVDDGRGALYDPDAAFVRMANGDFATDAGGNRIRRPEAGAANSFAEAQLVRTERGAVGHKSYDGWYPSFHATFNLTENLLARFAYAKTFGRPDFSNIIPNVQIDENDNPNPQPGDSPGRITLRNPGLLPWTANNYDFSLEYYFPRGGVLSAGVFQKDLSNFFGSVLKVADAADIAALGLEPGFVGWDLSTRVNVGDASVSGAEFNFSQPLTRLGSWGRYFNLIANATALHLQGPENSSFSRFIPRTGNIGLTFSKRPLIVMLKWNYRGRQRNSLQPSVAPNGFEFYDSRYNLDANIEYTFSKRFTLFANARNITNVPQILERYSPDTPDYSHIYRREEFGIQFALGVKGTF